MFKLTALFTTLVFGSTASISMASTRTYTDHAGSAPARIERPVFVRTYDRADHLARYRAGDELGPRRYRPSWVALSAPLQLSRAGQDCVEIRDRGTFTQLRLQTDRGRAQIDRVVVQFADGSRQVAALDRALDQRGEFVEIALDGNNRRVDRIFVTGSTGRRGDLQVFGI